MPSVGWGHIPEPCLSLWVFPFIYLSYWELAAAKGWAGAGGGGGWLFGSTTEERQRAGWKAARLNTMVKCLIRIQTKVNVHLRMINHCCRDVKVRVLSLGPRLLGKAFGALPLLPALPGGSAASGSRPRTVPRHLYGFSRPARQPGKK